MDENTVRKIVQEEIRNAAQKAQYSVTRTPVHTHNNIDSPNIPAHSVVGFNTLPASSGGVLDPALLNGQVFNIPENDSAFQPVIPTAIEFPITVIYGSGTTDASYTLTGTLAGAQTLTTTASLSAGATSATLTGAWADTSGVEQVTFSNGNRRAVTFTNGSANISWTGGLSSSATTSISAAGAVSGVLTGNYTGTTAQWAAQFGNGEIRTVQFTNGSPNITWTDPLLFNSSSTAITIIANARFHGGDAPFGTIINFRNDDDGINQIWICSAYASVVYNWAGYDFTAGLLITP